MNRDQALLNRLWSRVLLEELSRLGVTQVCVAPGSRSTPLTLEANANTAFTLHTHYDERGLGFMALGLAKASQQPVAVIVTSGTAVANLLPAIAESKLTGERLVVLTADRPSELVGCGANQAIVQSGIFHLMSRHRWNCLVLPSIIHFLGYLLRLMKLWRVKPYSVEAYTSIAHFLSPCIRLGMRQFINPIYNQFSVGVSKLGRIPKFTKD